MRKTLITVGFLSLLGLPIPAPGMLYTIPDYPLWTDTGLTLSSGDQVSITASGTWDFGVGYFGPEGTWSDPAPYDRFSSLANHGELIGFIGTDPFQGHYGDGSFFPQANGYITVGTSLLFVSSQNGHLWLGINDDAVSQAISDNFGSLSAQVSVVPEPSALALGLFALLVVFGNVKGSE
jgi:hypothetical protein